jgi:hypothetical protein
MTVAWSRKEGKSEVGGLNVRRAAADTIVKTPVVTSRHRSPNAARERRAFAPACAG